jgi:hypothetical protein
MSKSMFPLAAAVRMAVLISIPMPAISQTPSVPAFSGMEPGGEISGWQNLKPAPNAPDTRYTLVPDNGKTVVKAEANGAMSGLTYPVNIDLQRYPLLRWRWKIEKPVRSADMGTKGGDDYAARVYVIFDYPADKLSFGTRLKLKLAEGIYQQKIPTAAINYVWDNRQPVGTIQPNAYTDRARMIVINTGSAEAGQWVTHTRDLRADFRSAFGEEPPDVLAVAIATDTDNTGEAATAWYGDLEFLPQAEQ